MALGPTDVDAVAKSGLIASNWATRYPENSTPYTSTIVFLVRKGNPKGIKDFNDLVKPGVQVIAANPKTSGGARWAYLAAWLYADSKFGKDQAKSRDFVTSLYKNVPVLDSGARGSTTTFAQRGIGDVLVSRENEALSRIEGIRRGQIRDCHPRSQAFWPSLRWLRVVDKVAEKHGTYPGRLEAYLQYLYSDEGQEIARRRNYYRPRNGKIAANLRERTNSAPENFAGLHRRGIRRLAEGAGHAFCGWRRV